MTVPSSFNSSLLNIVISAAIALGLAILTAFWSLADPRAEIQAIKANYLTLREHDEFIRRFNSDISRIDAGEKALEQSVVRHQDLEAIRDRLNQMQGQIDLLISRSLIEPPPNVQRKPEMPR